MTSGNPGDPDAGNLFDSGEISKGDLFSYTFNQVGEFPYFCKIYPQFMKAVVKVPVEIDPLEISECRLGLRAGDTCSGRHPYSV